MRDHIVVMGMLALLGCSPELNWRTEHVGELSTLLPCKPDRATRSIALSGQAVAMEMVGCEASGALFTISRIEAQDSAQAQMLLASLRTASLQSMRATSVKAALEKEDIQGNLEVRVDGSNPGGQAVQARIKWLLRGKSIYQVATYAPRLQPQAEENLFGEIRFP